MVKQWFIICTAYFLSIFTLQGQVTGISSNEIQLRLQKLNTLGSVLYFAAHPDDENTRLISWLAQEKKYRTAYLSLTRGDGGQNLIGTDLGIDLGLIRTQELLAARAIDKGEQFFSSAYDFGFSKTHEETFSFWDKSTALREAVYIIRKFQPDVIINRFPPDKRGGHGHHQASAILAHEAFVAAANPKMFPEQLKNLQPWQAKRLLWNTANFGGANNTSDDQLKIDIGTYNPLLGKSHGEIAAQSRSQHKSQGFGAAASRGSSIEYFEFVDGSIAKNDLMEGIETSWKRISNSTEIQNLIDELNREYSPIHPEKSISKLLTLKALVQNINNNYWKDQKGKEIDELIIACAGIWIDATTSLAQYPINTAFEVNLQAIVRNPGLNVVLEKVNNNSINSELQNNKTWSGKESSQWNSISQPYWLNKPHSIGKFDVNEEDLGNPTNPNKPSVQFIFKIQGYEVKVNTTIKYKTVDPVQGELYEDIVIVPTISASLAGTHIITTNGSSQKINVTFTRHDLNKRNFEIKLNKATDWVITPEKFDLDFSNSTSITKEIEIHPKNSLSKEGTLSFTWNNEILRTIKTIAYTHIPSITWFPLAEAKIQNLRINNPIKKVAYIAGAGDLIAQSLNQIGIETTILNDKNLNPEILNQFEAIIVGVRYFNINDNSTKTLESLLKYAENGGTVIVQYHVNSKLPVNHIGPFPFSLSRARVTEEDAVVTFDKNDVTMKYPNQITNQDFEGWVQERGLYFAENIDSKYRTPIRLNDKDEPAHNGSLLICNFGKGKFVYTSLSFFRQLPAGVPGAYRLFVNLLAKENKQ